MVISLNEKRAATKRLVPVIRALRARQDAQEYLEQEKEVGRERLRRADFIWYEILLSLSTWGNSRGAKRLNFEALAYERLSRLSKPKRRDLIRKELTAAGLRYANKKVRYLLYNFELVSHKNGLEGAKREVLEATGCKGKLTALQQYKGIGEKYAHNIMMDVYHPQFHNSIAVDSRIKKISKELGLRSGTYSDYMEFYRKVASKIGIQPWELDRLLYKFEKAVLRSLKEAKSPQRN